MIYHSIIPINMINNSKSNIIDRNISEQTYSPSIGSLYLWLHSYLLYFQLQNALITNLFLDLALHDFWLRKRNMTIWRRFDWFGLRLWLGLGFGFWFTLITRLLSDHLFLLFFFFFLELFYFDDIEACLEAIWLDVFLESGIIPQGRDIQIWHFIARSCL
jgi:hypothetical protein